MTDMEFLSNQVGPLTVGGWIGALVVLSIVSSVFSAMRRKAGGGGAGTTLSAARCMGCGWQGKVSKYHRTCPKCGNSITRLSKNER